MVEIIQRTNFETLEDCWALSLNLAEAKFLQIILQEADFGKHQVFENLVIELREE